MSNQKEKDELQQLINEDEGFKESLGLSQEDNDEEVDFSVNVPTDPSYDDMIALALKAYQDMMNDVNNVPYKSKSRYLEIAQQFLNNAATSLKNKKDHELKLQQEQNKQRSSQSDDGDGTEESGNKAVIDRKELLRELRSNKG